MGFGSRFTTFDERARHNDMESLKRITLGGRAIPVRGNDIDTDRIIPARYLRCVTFDGLGEHAFEDDRAQLREAGKTHAFDDPRFAEASLLFVNKNFGCGSSREHAPQSIIRWGTGIRALVGESFAEIFFGNCLTLGVPCVTVDEETAEALMGLTESQPETAFELDLGKKEIRGGGQSWKVAIPDGARQAFLEGTWDSTAALLEAGAEIDATASALPYFNHWK